MKRTSAQRFIAAGLAIVAAMLAACRDTHPDRQKAGASGEPVPITIDYPIQGSIFPPEFPAPKAVGRIKALLEVPVRSSSFL
jgi:hypothetical protein